MVYQSMAGNQKHSVPRCKITRQSCDGIQAFGFDLRFSLRYKLDGDKASHRLQGEAVGHVR